MSRFSSRSACVAVDKDHPEKMLDLVQQDIRAIGRILNVSGKLYLSGPARLTVPIAGTIDAYLVTNTSTAGSTGAAFHTLKATRSGLAEGAVSINTSKAEMAAYTLYYCGTFAVGPGDIMDFTLTVTGAPAPTLTTSNITMLCLLTATETNQ